MHVCSARDACGWFWGTWEATDHTLVCTCQHQRSIDAVCRRKSEGMVAPPRETGRLQIVVYFSASEKGRGEQQL